MEDILTIFRALADPTRLRIMLLLLKMELAVGELAQILDQSQPRISRHIKILDEAGLAERRKEGSWVFLRPGKTQELDTLRRIFRSEKVVGSKQAERDKAQLSLVRQKRAEMADQYFTAHAEEWDAIRSLHVSETEVEQAMLLLLQNSDLGHLLDIGTGTGRMIELFGMKADRVTALDNSPEMLRLTRAKLEKENIEGETASGIGNKTELKLGDFNNLPVGDRQVNSVILHQVLHYAQNPEIVVSEVSRVLDDNGILLIADFASHEREELRRDHAHARLGFSDDSIGRWFKQNNIDLLDTRNLDGGELSVKIWMGQKSRLTRLHPDNSRSSLHNVEQKRNIA
ncbi:MAG: metalloregulator ArsR/SmtB family transcription factor [Parasphingorhabdus sp.]